MININFFEKKKTNILPYIAGGVFLVIVLIMGIYFFFVRMHYNQVIDDKNEWINTNVEEVVLSRRSNYLDQLSKQSLNVQETLNENQYPMNRVAEEIVSVIPDETGRVASFQLVEPNQISLILENTETTLGENIVGELESLSFVDGVQFLHAESQSEEDKHLRYELIIDLNEEMHGKGEIE